MMDKSPKPKIMVSSTVYGIEELLERIYTLLTSYGFEVWLSHKGTLPVCSSRTAFENCIHAVEKCDLFLGIITPSYGSGCDPNQPDSLSITHQEIRRAVELNKPRWLLAHEHVVFARTLLDNLGYKGKLGRQALKLGKNDVFKDLRVIDLYEEATINLETPHSIPLAERRGNWVQKFRSDGDGLSFVSAQFYRYQEAEEFLKENFGSEQTMAQRGHSK
jgi:hypothetical protein